MGADDDNPFSAVDLVIIISYFQLQNFDQKSDVTKEIAFLSVI
jgi:hypothetical protein